ncbi:MAG: hypothetical protein QW286_03115, partial [Candidatus Aenigmatarchaeota archaeon]
DAEVKDSNPYGASCTLAVDGKETDTFAGKMSKELTLGDGAHRIYLNCSDAAGNKAEDERIFEINRTQNADEPKPTKKISILI